MSGAYGAHLFDLSNGEAPVWAGSEWLPNSVEECAYDDAESAYFASVNSGLVVAHTEAELPSEIYGITGPYGSATGVARVGDYVYLAAGAAGVHVYPLQCTAGMGVRPEEGAMAQKIPVAAVPNPGSVGMTISWRLERAATGRAVLLDAGGRVVRTLQEGRLAAGTTAVVWDGADDGGHPSPAGVYFVRVAASGSAGGSGRMVFLR